MKKIFKVALVAGAVLCVGKLILALKESADYVPERWTPDFSGEGYDSCGKRKDVSRIEIVVKNAADGSTDAPTRRAPARIARMRTLRHHPPAAQLLTGSRTSMMRRSRTPRAARVSAL